MEAMKKITFMEVVQEGISIGLKNVVSLIGATILWLLTLWIPYLNVGTTIAILNIPIELSKGKVISPTFIFNAKYRQYMGEFFTLIGLKWLSILPAMLFMIVPAIIIAIGWSLAIYILLDKGIAPGEALVRSNKATYGYKWTIFFIFFLIFIVYYLMAWVVFGIIPFLGWILNIVFFLVYQAITLGCWSVIYRKLVNEDALEDIQSKKASEMVS